MQLKKIAFEIHKFIGLFTGIIVFIVAITGCLWVFKDEIETKPIAHFNPEQQAAKNLLKPTEVAEIAHRIYPDHHLHGVVFKNNATTPLEIIYYDAEPEFYESVFVHPISGEVIAKKNHFNNFFGFVLKGHMRLWLPKKIGEQLVSVAIVLFLFSLLTGFILWYPKNFRNVKKRIRFSWTKKSNWKRINFDLHSVIGFYLLPLAFIIAFTGLIISYAWVKKIAYASLGGTQSTVFTIPKNKGYLTSAVNPLNEIIPLLKQQYTQAKSFELHYPTDKNTAIYVEVSNSEGVYYDSDYLFFDQHTLEQLRTESIYNTYNATNFSAKAIRMNYDIHVGSIGGIAGKIIAFITSLTIASLPVTGFLIWYGRNYKKKKG